VNPKDARVISIILVLAIMVICALVIISHDDDSPFPSDDDRRATYTQCLEADELPDEACSTPVEQVETVDRFAEFTRCVRADELSDEVCTEQLHEDR
jgi:hypothetical protein